MNKDFRQLRKILGGNDSFVNRGHTVTGLRRRKRGIPEWTRSNEKVKEVLLKSFPRLEIDARQRLRAARWARIIHLYFRLQWTLPQVAAELDLKVSNVHDLIRNIKRVSLGRRADGTGELGGKPRGRPRKHAPDRTP